MELILSSTIIILGIILLSMDFRTSRKILLVMAISLLLYKSIEYTIYGLNLQTSKIPIEYSTLTYFLFSIQVIFNIKPLKLIVTFMAFISGLGYLLVFMFLGQQYIIELGLFTTIMAFINHSICFLGSLILMKSEQFQSADKKKILLFTTIYVIYVIIASKLIEYTQSYIFILMLLEGDILNRLVPSESISTLDYLAYFLIIFVVYQFLIKIFIWLNHHIYRIKKGKNHEHTI
ncbi:MAG: hypothetical protein WC964_03740 [Acholeplasmataceae bacterium]